MGTYLKSPADSYHFNYWQLVCYNTLFYKRNKHFRWESLSEKINSNPPTFEVETPQELNWVLFFVLVKQVDLSSQWNKYALKVRLKNTLQIRSKKSTLKKTLYKYALKKWCKYLNHM